MFDGVFACHKILFVLKYKYMEENQGKKTIPDLGEGIKPEDVVFSSQNIIGGSVAGSDKKFFGRVKKEVSLKDKINEQLKRNQVANRSRLQKLLQNKKFWIILASILVALALCLALVFILTRKNSHEEGEEVSEIYSGVEEEDEEVAAGIAQYEENISTAANSGNQSEANKLILEYSKFLFDNEYFDNAVVKLDTVDTSLLSPEEQVELYAAYRDCYGLFALNEPEKYREYNEKIREVITNNSETLGTGYVEGDE